VTTASDQKVDGFDYVLSSISDVEVVTEPDNKGIQRVSHVLLDDEELEPSDRFWNSLMARYQFNRSIFNYFGYDEVFGRISEKEPNDQMRLCIERGETNAGEPRNRLLAVSNPKKPIVGFDDLTDTLDRYQGRDITYSDGIVKSSHTPRAGASNFDVLGDSFKNQFMMATPIDGYGLPNIYLALLRLVCTNGMIAMTKAFRSQLSLGKGDDDVVPAIIRALDGFNHDEGFAALRQRIEAAGNSWASVYEQQSLYKSLVRLHSDKLIDLGGTSVPKGSNIAKHLRKEEAGISPVLTAFHRMTGDPTEHYGLANLDSLSAKRQRTLPVNCTMYDMINFATEVATHFAEPNGSLAMQSWVGESIKDEYDMEGTKDRFGDFADFHLDAKMGAGLTGSEHAG
jgi:hypothetical protein